MRNQMRKLLIANRGEIARRIIRTAHRMGLQTVAVYSDADADAPYVREATQAVHIGASPAAESYLRGDVILAAAAKTGADAVHPGYGFLSENVAFAESCADAGVIFVGPPSSAIKAMGLKDQAKKLMKLAGVPIVPGYQGDDQTLERLQRAAAATGYPILIKAVAGGGGKGMRLVHKAEDFASELRACQGEALRTFGNDVVLLEKYVANPRHIEMQIFADTYGNVVHLFERDCSVQRRHQKVIEEAPAPLLPADMRKAMGDAAVKAAQAIGYVGAGTIEYIVECDDHSMPQNFYFMEMNTRLQVEHPVTEMITGLDLVEWQLRVARGERLPKLQDEIQINGHALEARLYAEDADGGFLPSIGTLNRLRFPANKANLRIDSGIEEGGEISPFYDPMIAKVIAYGPDRRSAIETLLSSLDETIINGVKTNRGFLARVLGHQSFRDAKLGTHFIADHSDALQPPREVPDRIYAIAALALIMVQAKGDTASPWSQMGHWRLNLEPSQPVELGHSDGSKKAMRLTSLQNSYRIDGLAKPLIASARKRDDITLDVDFDGEMLRAVVIIAPTSVEVRAWGQTFLLLRTDAITNEAVATQGDGTIKAPMPGRVLDVHVKAGQKIAKGDALLTLEAMKMEQRLTAPLAGIVKMVHVQKDAQVRDGQILIEIDAGDA
jgi:3-methylcrotonyl-CoA carboxylase alpha subunit